MIYSVFVGMCYYAMFTSCPVVGLCFDDYMYDKVGTAYINADYCNFMYDELGEIDTTCESSCEKGDFYK